MKAIWARGPACGKMWVHGASLWRTQLDYQNLSDGQFTMPKKEHPHNMITNLSPAEVAGLPPLPSMGARADMERMHRAIGKIMSERDFDTPEEANAFLQTVMAGRTVDEIVAMVESDPEDDALELVQMAMEAGSITERLSLCRKALKLDPHCVDARVMLAGLNAHSAKDFAKKLRTIVREAEGHFGETYMEENRGHFWGMVETRPYMRARLDLAEILHETGALVEAIAECEGMMELNPNDNLGVRDLLRGYYLEAGNLEGVRRLNEHYDESILASAAWSAVIERWLAGALAEAERLAREAHARNPHVARYFTGSRGVPDDLPLGYALGSPEEAKICAGLLIKAWKRHPQAMKWLRELNLT